MKIKNDGKILTVMVFLIATLLIGGVFVNASGGGNKQNLDENRIVIFDQSDDTVTVTIPTGEYEIKNTEQDAEISIEDFGSLLVPGKPNLPSRIFAIAIPPGAIMKDVTFDTGEGILVPGTYEILPVPLPRVIGEEDPLIYEQNQKTYDENFESVYGSNNQYPENMGEFVRTAGYRKYNLVDVRVTPFTYRPQFGQLMYYPKITVEITYMFPEEGMEIMVDSLVKTERIAEEIIANYDQAKGWYPEGSPVGFGLHDYVIITLDSLIDSVTPLVEWENYKGRNVEVVTTTWINNNYDGYDLPEKIRNFLREKLPSEEWGIEDVLLVGHYGDVPMRRCWQDLGYGKPETDFYYAELTLPDIESWDADEDQRYGEDFQDPIDFYAEVNVGRIPWSDPETVLSICEKSVAYEQNNDPTFKKNILLLGAFFWDNDPNPRTDTAVLMEYKVDSDLHPWMSDWTMTRMYEEGHSTYPMDYDLRNSNVGSVWSSGKFGFVNWAGHGSPYSSHRYHDTGEAFVATDTCPLLNDNYPSIIFADACSNSDTDNLNIGQAMLKQGGVGFLGATKVALGMPGWDHPNDGSSQSLDYYFTTSVTSGDYTQGEAHQYALREMYTRGLWSAVKYEMFEWGAFWGNPNLGIAPVGESSNPPSEPDQPIGPEEGDIKVEYAFLTSTTDPDSDQVYYCFSWGDGSVDWAGPYDSGDTAEVSHIWHKEGEYSIKIKAQDVHGAESDWSDPLTIIIYDPISINKITGGFSINAIIQNIGTHNVVEYKWNIILNGSIILIGKETTGLINVNVGEDASINTGFIFGLGRVNIAVTVDDNEKTATGFLFGPIIILT